MTQTTITHPFDLQPICEVCGASGPGPIRCEVCRFPARIIGPYSEGWSANNAGEPHANPYPAGSDEAREWQEGWDGLDVTMQFNEPENDAVRMADGGYRHL